jgi:hypothetical protein
MRKDWPVKGQALPPANAVQRHPLIPTGTYRAVLRQTGIKEADK